MILPAPPGKIPEYRTRSNTEHHCLLAKNEREERGDKVRGERKGSEEDIKREEGKEGERRGGKWKGREEREKINSLEHSL